MCSCHDISYMTRVIRNSGNCIIVLTYKVLFLSAIFAGKNYKNNPTLNNVEINIVIQYSFHSKTSGSQMHILQCLKRC